MDTRHVALDQAWRTAPARPEPDFPEIASLRSSTQSSSTELSFEFAVDHLEKDLLDQKSQLVDKLYGKIYMERLTSEEVGSGNLIREAALLLDIDGVDEELTKIRATRYPQFHRKLTIRYNPERLLAILKAVMADQEREVLKSQSGEEISREKLTEAFALTQTHEIEMKQLSKQYKQALTLLSRSQITMKEQMGIFRAEKAALLLSHDVEKAELVQKHKKRADHSHRLLLAFSRDLYIASNYIHASKRDISDLRGIHQAFKAEMHFQSTSQVLKIQDLEARVKKLERERMDRTVRSRAGDRLHKTEVARLEEEHFSELRAKNEEIRGLQSEMKSREGLQESRIAAQAERIEILEAQLKRQQVVRRFSR